MPIVKKDKDIDNLLQLPNPEVTRVIDIFIKSSSKIHVLRAIEPNLRLGSTFANHLAKTNQLEQCVEDAEDANKCLRFGSKKQICESVVQYEDVQGGN